MGLTLIIRPVSVPNWTGTELDLNLTLTELGNKVIRCFVALDGSVSNSVICYHNLNSSAKLYYKDGLFILYFYRGAQSH